MSKKDHTGNGKLSDLEKIEIPNTVKESMKNIAVSPELQKKAQLLDNQVTQELDERKLDEIIPGLRELGLTKLQLAEDQQITAAPQGNKKNNKREL